MPTDRYIQPRDDSLCAVKHKWRAIGKGPARHLRHWFECSKCGHTILATYGEPPRPLPFPMPAACKGCGRKFVHVGEAVDVGSAEKHAQG